MNTLNVSLNLDVREAEKKLDALIEKATRLREAIKLSDDAPLLSNDFSWPDIIGPKPFGTVGERFGHYLNVHIVAKPDGTKTITLGEYEFSSVNAREAARLLIAAADKAYPSGK